MRISDWSSDVCSSDLRLRQTRCRNILAKCSRSIKQLMAARDFPPKRIMILHIQVHGFVRSAMVNQIRLTVPFESQRTDLHGPCDRQLDYAALFVTAKRCWNPDQQRFNAQDRKSPRLNSSPQCATRMP